MKSKAFSTLEKGLRILELYTMNKRLFTAKEISQRLDLPISSTYKYLDILVKRGLLKKQDGSNYYKIGLAIFKLCNVFMADFNLIDVALPHMKSLSKQSGETVILTAIKGNEIICLEKIEPERMVILTLEKGDTLPLHTGATAKVLMAYQDNGFIDNYIKEVGLSKVTNKTITDPEILLAELNRTRQLGYVTSNSEADEGATGVAAPIFDHSGKAIAGLTLAGPSERIDDKAIKKMIKMVKDEAMSISCELGYTDA